MDRGNKEQSVLKLQLLGGGEGKNPPARSGRAGNA
jgi:hypothetical protein